MFGTTHYNTYTLLYLSNNTVYNHNVSNLIFMHFYLLVEVLKGMAVENLIQEVSPDLHVRGRKGPVHVINMIT